MSLKVNADVHFVVCNVSVEYFLAHGYETYKHGYSIFITLKGPRVMSDDIFTKYVYLERCHFVKCVPNSYKWNCGIMKFIIIIYSEYNHWPIK